jgi:acetylcholinesterase
LISVIVNDVNMTKSFNENYEHFAPICFFFEENQLKSAKEIGEIFKKFYLPFDTVDIRSLNSLSNFFADVIGYTVHKFVHFVSDFTDVYYYKVSYSGRFSGFKHPNEKPYGVSHGDDIQYCFHAAHVGPMINKTDPENLMVERMTRMWSAFAATG